MAQKCVLLSTVAAFLASAEPLVDEDTYGLSLLQMRVEKHREGPTLRAAGSTCDDSEVLTFEQCWEAYRGGAISGVSIIGQVPSGNPKVQRGYGDTGCYMHVNNNVYWNPGPGANLHNFRPICAPNGGRAAELITPMSGTNNDPFEFKGYMPADVELRAQGTNCDECGILTFDQCNKATREQDVKLGLVGMQTNPPEVQLNPGYLGCYKWIGNGRAYFNPGSPGNTLEQYAPAAGLADTFAGSQPICGVCVTTTTTEPPEVEEVEEDAAAAVGDPHLVTNTGSRFDYS